jgi:hypothetical protein
MNSGRYTEIRIALFLNNIMAEVTATVRPIVPSTRHIMDSDCHLDRLKRNNSNEKRSLRQPIFLEGVQKDLINESACDPFQEE